MFLLYTSVMQDSRCTMMVAGTESVISLVITSSCGFSVGSTVGSGTGVTTGLAGCSATGALDAGVASAVADEAGVSATLDAGVSAFEAGVSTLDAGAADEAGAALDVGAVASVDAGASALDALVASSVEAPLDAVVTSLVSVVLVVDGVEAVFVQAEAAQSIIAARKIAQVLFFIRPSSFFKELKINCYTIIIA